MKIIDSKIWDIGTKLYDLIIINLLWMIFSIPLITLGPATYAGLKCIEELEDESSHNIFILYLNNFKENFFSHMLGFNTLLGIIIVSGVFAINMFYRERFILTGLCIFIMIESILAISTIFITYYKNPIDLILKSIIIGNKKVLNILLALVLCVCVFIVSVFIPVLFPITIALCMLISYKIVYKLY